jgi:DNA-binding NarL/FixJ family response regulator
MEAIRVLLVEDHNLVRNGIKALLQQRAALEVVGEADNGNDALRLVEELKPDIVLMDIALPGANGLVVTEDIKRRFPSTRVVILSAHINEIYVSNALRAGALGYLLKDADIAQLEHAIEAALRDETYLTPAVSRQLVDGYMRRLDGKEEPAVELTARQMEILKLMADDLSTKEIAARLFISEKTVLAHRAQMMHRLGVRDVTGLMRYAIRKGIISA